MRERKGRKSKSVFCVLLESEWRKKAKRDYYHTKHAIRRLLFNQIRSWTFIPDNNFCLYKPFSSKNTIKDFLNIIIFFLICMSTFKVQFCKIAIFQKNFSSWLFTYENNICHTNQSNSIDECDIFRISEELWTFCRFWILELWMFWESVKKFWLKRMFVLD